MTPVEINRGREGQWALWMEELVEFKYLGFEVVIVIQVKMCPWKIGLKVSQHSNDIKALIMSYFSEGADTDRRGKGYNGSFAKGEGALGDVRREDKGVPSK